MTARDRLVAIVVVALAILAGFWFLLIAPKRDQAASLQNQISAAQTQLSAAQSTVTTNSQARAAYNRDYATVARLGKAVPSDPQTSSLLVQLQAAAQNSRVDFRSIDQGAATIGPTPTPPAAASSAVATANGSSSTAAATGSTTASSTPASTSAGTAPVSATATTQLAPGTAVGSASLTTIPFTFVFRGSYFKLARFIQAVQSFTTVQGHQVNVHGRLLVIGSVSLGASIKGFPSINATITATAYQLPADQGLTAGATPVGPAATTGSQATASATGSSAASTAPAATASLVGTR